ncbi:unnamed protein product [Brachionus calyciflorus]|uniref:Chitin-binding type-2 domain-containing protein n=1 Tax=Brachionus calyciflorus TaxID=104777 RepID=A0A813TNU1_9BILA|nr:unnamed protein product [Brachionus calyciflorus]
MILRSFIIYTLFNLCITLEYKLATKKSNTTTKSPLENSRRSLFNYDTEPDRIKFIISKADYENVNQQIDYQNIPIVLPADAIIQTSDKEDKLKNNFSKIAKVLIENNQSENKTEKLTRSITTTTVKMTTTTIDVGTFCILKTDGLYSDPGDCESFVICFANRTFKTKCAYGTLWNHERSQCDFAEKVDCTRSTTLKILTTTTQEPETTTTIKTTTLIKKPKLFVVTSKPNLIKPIEPIASTLTNNIIIASIIIPSVILLIVSIILTLWYWKKKFKMEAQKLHAKELMSNRNTPNSKPSTSTLNECKKEDLSFFKKVSSLTLLEKLTKLAAKHGQFSPKIIQKEDKTSLNNNKNNIETPMTKDANSQTNLPFENTGFVKEDPANERMVLSENNMTNLSSQFDENNWDYNIGSRALYLSQPWVKARYIHTLGSESMVTSGVLTLDPTIELGAEISKIIESGSESVTESEGYYA